MRERARTRAKSSRRAKPRPAAGATDREVAFEVELRATGPSGAWVFVALPAEVHAALGGDRARIPVAGTADGHPIRTSAAPMRGCHLFAFNRELQEATGKGAGDRVRFVLTRDRTTRTVEAPRELAAALRAAGARAAFDALSFTARKELVRGVEGAKRPETRARRIAAAVESLGGKPARPRRVGASAR